MKRKFIFFLILLIAVSGLVYTRHILTKDRKPEKIPIIRIVEERRTPLFIPHYLAVQLGFFSEQKIDVRLSTVKTGESAHRLLAENKADVIIAGPGQAILAGPPGAGQTPVAFAGITKRDGAFLLARESKSAFHWEDVTRRTVISGAPTEDTSMVLEHLLRENNISPNWDVNVIENLPLNLRAGTFKSGTGSFIVVEEPDALRLENEKAGKVVISLGETAGEMPGAVYLANPDYLDIQNSTVQKLVNGLYKAQQWLKYHNAQEIANEVKKYFPDYEQDELISIIKRYQKIDLWSEKPVINKTAYQNLYAAVENSGELVNKVPYSKAVINRFAQKAVQVVHYVPEDRQKPKPGLNWKYLKYLFTN